MIEVMSSVLLNLVGFGDLVEQNGRPDFSWGNTLYENSGGHSAVQLNNVELS